MTRRRRSGDGHTALWIVAACVLVVASMVPAGSVTTATLGRDSTINVTTDPAGIVGLDTAATVRIGHTDPLVEVTNNVQRDMTVTVTLTAYTADGAVVVGGVSYGDSATFALTPAANETAAVDLSGGCSLDGETLTYDIDGNTSAFDGTAPRSALIQASNATRKHVAFQNVSDHELMMIDRSGATTKFGHTASGFGPPSRDFDCDGRTETPYTTTNGDIVLVDATGDRQQLLAGDARTDARLAVADLDGDDDPAVLYSNVSDNGTLYRVENGGSPVKVADVTVHSVTRRADVNGDGDLDIAFTDPADGNLKYYDPSLLGNVGDTGVTPRTLSDIGDPADFDGDGEVRIPFVDSRNKLLLVDSAGNTEQISNGADTVIGSLGTFDYDDDGKLEVVFVDETDSWLKHVEMYGSTTIITDTGGTKVAGDTNGTA